MEDNQWTDFGNLRKEREGEEKRRKLDDGSEKSNVAPTSEKESSSFHQHRKESWLKL